MVAIGRRPGRGAAGPSPGPPSQCARSRGLGPLQRTARSRESRLSQPGPGQAGPGPTAGVGPRRVAPRVPRAPAPRLPAGSSPPAPDWLSGPKPAWHWPARLSLDLAPPPAGAGHRVSVRGYYPSLPVVYAEVGCRSVGGQALPAPELGRSSTSAEIDSCSPNGGGRGRLRESIGL